ncbi:phage Mu protein F like protein [Sphingobacterium allocomposti]|uniref:Phage Mu protein F like protein n=1 Tax=Sphingobacterium allocomposti TaxID=415956 RepID=A0A5S5D2N7_9SPHI|nr:phage minor head protein [Sphingobacterium composti Yoo et al. 2007 non Ten et al. 2007]TYP89416.1 phage Mu protein F like protein [Sphingobacterium composti Yoo et al. 2007 non Ten et al. 2007]
MNPRLQLRRYANRENRKLKAYERKYAKVIYSILDKQLEEAIRNIQHGAMFLDYDMYDRLSDLYREVGVDLANDQYDALTSFHTKASNFFLNQWLEFMTNYILANMGLRVSRINETTRKKIQETIAIGNNLGMTIEKISSFLRQRIGTFNRYRATMIARTEIAEAANVAKEKSSQDWEQETGENVYKMWIHRYAKEPRLFHHEQDNGKAIPKSEYFLVRNPKTGLLDEMMRPHDPNVGGEQNINCSCVAVYVSEGYARRVNATK